MQRKLNHIVLRIEIFNILVGQKIKISIIHFLGIGNISKQLLCVVFTKLFSSWLVKGSGKLKIELLSLNLSTLVFLFVEYQ